ncbi:ER lumen protein retaining receptor [Babesia duncani]|uniref:ER lumen protein-retaining receptor n=1 Tax=Babesia duncani TaxID=323732 RepID=A0AAD9UNX9_9APIC|nr:ER lumen protein retaining receptor [Babesia duncani]
MSYAILQWFYFRVYRTLVSWLTEARVACFKRGHFCWKLWHHFKQVLCKIILKSFLFRKTYKSQATVSVREVTEGHNESVVILDWYLPKWTVKSCEKCGRIKKQACDSHKDPDKNFITEQTTFIPGQTHPPKVESKVIANRHSPANVNPSLSTINDNVNTNNENKIDGSHIENNRHGQDDDVIHDALSGSKVDLIPTPKIIRAVLVIISDLNISYNICYQPVVCLCNDETVDDLESKRCGHCFAAASKDHDGLNKLPPGLPQLLCFINEANKLGFVCVHIHLNINLGMAMEAFPTTIGLRAFPFSLYSDTLLDIDAALKKIAHRYPNTPLIGLGVGVGGNIFLEYLCTDIEDRGISTEFEYDFEGIIPQDKHIFKRENGHTINVNGNMITTRTPVASRSQEYRTCKSDSADPGHEPNSLINLTEGHFQHQLTESLRVETGVVYPPIKLQDNDHNHILLSAVAVINPNLRAGAFSFSDFSNANPKKCAIMSTHCTSVLLSELKSLLKSCHCARQIEATAECTTDCCHYTKKMANGTILEKLMQQISRISSPTLSFCSSDSLDALLDAIHQEYTLASKEVNRNVAFVRYGQMLYSKFGIYSQPTFKVCVTKTVSYGSHSSVSDSRIPSRLEETPSKIKYNVLNREFLTNLIAGSASKNKNGHKSVRGIGSLVANDYREHVEWIRNISDKVYIPTLLLTSKDNGLCSFEDLDIFESVRNPNIVHYVSPSGGYGTFLSGYSVYLIRFSTPIQQTYNRKIDKFNYEKYLLGPVMGLSLITTYHYGPVDILWTFSIWLESVAILPQLTMLYQQREVENITSHYVVTMGLYRAFYLLNWVYRYFFETPAYVCGVCWLAGLVQTLLYVDFFYYFAKSKWYGKRLVLPFTGDV